MTYNSILPLPDQVQKLYKRTLAGIEAFKKGEMILVGDDGRRENEIDLVFHSQAATAEKVNFAITHAKGLLCVAVDHTIADKLGFYSAPRFPHKPGHTAFTVSVDAAQEISTGISASDRAYTIKLIGDPKSSVHDFISPGHVFPVVAMQGDLLSRCGHTEALSELCSLAQMTKSAAMCEILENSGEAFRPGRLSSKEEACYPFINFPYISTIDLLWFQVFFAKKANSYFKTINDFPLPNDYPTPKCVFKLEREFEEKITLDTTLLIYQKEFNPHKIRISVNNSIFQWHNGLSPQEACAEIILTSIENPCLPLSESIENFSDLSAREGLKTTKTSTKRIVSYHRALNFLANYFNISLEKNIEFIKFIDHNDAEFLKAIYTV
ncbi:MAG: 3,4-dihydroxy-2-butanone-4-phosphate synthase [Silvanigrellaceae bacterium]|nr:3,4-dihydroxy-2-butanone-4-phosphate synthase [Silvanigrellaceae bacterium]